jgi:nucleotide-binding universal stress UspA family protein
MINWMPRRAGETGDVKRHGLIVVGVDGSPLSIDALRVAAEIAEGAGSVLQPITAWHRSPAPHRVPIARLSPGADAETALFAAVRDVFGDSPPERVQPKLVEAPAVEALISASAGADLLVVGSRGHGGVAGVLLGSVSAACAEYADAPVLVLHGPTGAQSPAPDHADPR